MFTWLANQVFRQDECLPGWQTRASVGMNVNLAHLAGKPELPLRGCFLLREKWASQDEYLVLLLTFLPCILWGSAGMNVYLPEYCKRRQFLVLPP
jgi:hypothetical protein